MGARRLFALVQALPYESVTLAMMREQKPPPPKPGEQPAASWGDLARTLSKSKAMKKPKAKGG